MFDSRRVRTRKVSMRSIIALGGVAVATFGLAQTTGTLANPTDSVVGTAQVQTGNFYPAPLPVGNASCNRTGTLGFYDVNLSWPAAAAGTSFKVTIFRGSDVREGPLYVTSTTKKIAYSTGGLGTYTLVVQSVSDADTSIPAANRQVSSGSLRQNFYHNGAEETTCSGSPSRVENKNWENQKDWTPSMGSPWVQSRISNPEAIEMQQDVIEETKVGEATTQDPASTTTAPDSTTAEAPTSSTTTPATTTPATTTPATTTPDATTSPETPPTENPKLVLTGTVESGGLTAGWTAGGNKVAVVDADGKELASGRVESGSTLHWNNGQLWIVGATEVYRIMESPQDGKWKFYTDSGQNMPDFE